jgi:hypothetical protein
LDDFLDDIIQDTSEYQEFTYALFSNPQGFGSIREHMDQMKEEAESAFGDSFFNQDVCYKKSFRRGVGEVLTDCKSGEKSGLLCYPKCKAGFYGFCFHVKSQIL